MQANVQSREHGARTLRSEWSGLVGSIGTPHQLGADRQVPPLYLCL